MKTLLLTVLAALLPLAAIPAQEEKEKSPAERILELTGFETAGFDAARAAFRPVIEEFRAEGYDAKVLQKILEESMTLGQKIAEKHAPAFQDQLTDILAEANAELDVEPEPNDGDQAPTPPEAKPQQN